MQTQKLNPEEVKPPPKGMMLLTMRAIAVLGGTTDSFAIRDYIARIMNSDLSNAQVTLMLWRLEQRELVSSEVPKQEGKLRRGRPRKTFSLTPGGKKALEFGVRLFTDSDTYEGSINEESTSASVC